MLAVLRVVHREQPVVDALHVEQPLLGTDQGIGLLRAGGIAERALRVGFVAERLRQRIELGAARCGSRARAANRACAR